jgi:S-DNA-T family DNA segregation ATPase FtsK/SpoIIIE
MGKDIAGHPFSAMLDRMPHLLVAGTTGSGKSMFLHTMIMSILLKRTPDEVRFILIDPKRLEFTPYNGIPHLLAPVVTDAREASRILIWLLREMDRRYLIFARLGVRNIQGYRNLPPAADEEEPHEVLPMLVVIVDELADLMMTGTHEIENAITRLAQMARAVGIHLVLATQRPSVDVLTGIIKANFPARIAFQVASKTDSRTILDSNGAESLLGAGDLLFIPPGKSEAHRLHAPFIPDADRDAIIEYLKDLASSQPEGSVTLLDEKTLNEEIPNDADEDPLLEDAKRIVIQHQQGSTSLLQRKLRIGYTRAARLIDMLERRGIVGPFEGSKAREVLIDRESLETEIARDI